MVMAGTAGRITLWVVAAGGWQHRVGAPVRLGVLASLKVWSRIYQNVLYGLLPCDKRWREAAPVSTGHKVSLEFAYLFVWQDNFCRKLRHSVSI